MQNSALIKRIIISVTFLIIFGIVGFFVYYAISPAPICTDKKQNQNEKGIDCGGPCSPCKEVEQMEDLLITETAVTLGGNGTYDAVAKITNPNNTIGASFFKYEFILKDVNGSVVGTRQGDNFILPADSKYVAELSFEIENRNTPTIAEFVISEEKWEKLNNIGKPQIGVYNKNFGKVPVGEGSGADGIIRNESGYDLGEISLVVVLRSEKGEIVGVNKTKKNNIRAREERDFRLTWPYQLAAPVQSIEVDPQSNVFDSQNFSYTVQ